MRAFFRPSRTTFAASVFAVAAIAGAAAQPNNPPGPPPPGPPSAPWMQHWATDREAMLDAELAVLKAGLRLTPDQMKLWEPFESAVRDADRMRMAHMQEMMERMEKMRRVGPMGPMGMDQMGPMGMGMEGGESMSPVDRLQTMASHLTDAGAALKKVADAAKPLYASLDDPQKRMFGLLAPEVIAMRHGHGMGPWGPRRRFFEDEGDPDGE